jgi:hypothetical protein
MRQRASVLLAPKMCGKATGNEGAAWMAGKECLPTLSLSMNPKMPLAWLYVTAFSIFTCHIIIHVSHYHTYLSHHHTCVTSTAFSIFTTVG